MTDDLQQRFADMAAQNWVRQRSDHLSSWLAKNDPTAALALLGSNLQNHELYNASYGLSVLQGQVPGLNLSLRNALSEFARPGMNIGPYIPTQGDINMAQEFGRAGSTAFPAQLPPSIAGVAKWLTQLKDLSATTNRFQTTAAQSGVTRPLGAQYLAEQAQGQVQRPSFSGVDPRDDPSGIANLILGVQDRPDGTHVVVRTSVLNMLEREKQLSEVKPIPSGPYKFAERQGEVPILNPAVQQTLATPQQQQAIQNAAVQDALRAKGALVAIASVFPDAHIDFQGGGITSRLTSDLTSATNVVTFPVSLVLREYGAAVGDVLSALGMQKTGGGALGGGWATPAEVFKQVSSTHGLAWGEQYAAGAGYKPTDPKYGAVVGMTNFLVGWEYDPLIVAGKIGAGVKLAKTLPLTEATGEATRGITGAVYRLMGQAPSAWTYGEDGKQVLSGMLRFTDKVGEQAAATALRDAYQLPADVASDIAGAKNLPELQKLVLDRLEGNVLKPGYLRAWQEEKAVVESTLKELADRGLQNTDEYANAVMKQRGLALRIGAADRGPGISLLREFPRKSWGHAVSEGVAHDLAQGTIGKIAARQAEWVADLHIPGTRVGLKRLWEDIPMHEVRNPFGAEARPGELEIATKGMDDMLKDFGVKPAARKEVTNKLINAKTSDEFFNVFTQDAADAIDAAANGRKLSPHVTRDTVQFFKNRTRQEFGVVPKVDTEGVSTYEKTWYELKANPDGTLSRHALPSKKTELFDRMILPYHETALDLTGFWRRLLQQNKSGRLLKLWRGDPEAMARGLLGWEDVITGLWKDGVLLSRAPAVLQRTQFEQAARMAAFGKASALNRPLEWIKWLKDSEWDKTLINELKRPARPGQIISEAEKAQNSFDSMLGLISNQMATGPRALRNKSIVNYNALTSEADKVLALDGLRSDLLLHYGDEGMRELARLSLASSGDVVNDWVNWATTTKRGKQYVEDMRPIIEKGHVPGEALTAEARWEDRLRHFASQNLAEQDGLLAISGAPTEAQNAIRRAIIHGYATKPGGKDALASIQGTLDEAKQIRIEADALAAAGETEEAVALHQQADAIAAYARKGLEQSGLKVKPRFKDANQNIEDALANALGEQVPIGSSAFTTYLKELADNGDWVPPNHIPMHYTEAVGGSGHLHDFRNKMYRNLLSREDAWLSRKPLFRQFAEQRYRELRALGVGEKAARREAAFWGAQQTSSTLYDLASRTSAQHFFRHLAPFLPAYQEIMTTWMWKIPNRMYPIVGHAYYLTRAKQIVDGLKSIGLDPNSARQIPLLGPMITKALGGPLGSAEFQLSNLNLVTQSTLPGLGPIPATILGKLARSHFMDGVIDPLADTVMPFGLDSYVGPALLNRGYEAIASLYGWDPRPPWEAAWGEAQDIRYSFAKDDSIRAVWYERMKDGNKPPDPAKYDDQNKFKKDNDAWIESLIHDANRRLAGLYAFRSALSTVSPVPITITSDVQKDVIKFYDQLSKIAQGSPAASALYNQWYEDHPGAELYLTPTSVKTGTFNPTSDDDTIQQILDAKRRLLSPQEFIALGEGLTARRLYERAYAQGMDNFSDPAAALRDNYNRTQYSLAKAESWDRYLRLNESFGKTWNEMLAAPKKDGLPQNSLEVERMEQFRTLSLILANDPLITDGDPTIESNLKQGAGVIGRLLSSGEFKTPDGTKVEWGPSTTAFGKATDWWWNTVATPTYEQMDALRAQADKANTTDEKGAVFDKMRRILDAQTPQSHNGELFPTLQEYWWGSKKPDDVFKSHLDALDDPLSQAATALKWTLRKPEWLTTFQLQKAGMRVNGQTADFLNTVNDAGKTIDTYMRQHNIVPSSTEGEKIKAKTQQFLAQQAATTGNLDLWKLMQEPPAARLVEAGTFNSVPDMGRIFSAGFAIQKAIDSAAYGTKGTTELRYKSLLYQTIDQMRAQDPNLQAAWDGIRLALNKDKPPTYHGAYDSVLFGDFFGSGA